MVDRIGSSERLFQCASTREERGHIDRFGVSVESVPFELLREIEEWVVDSVMSQEFGQPT